MTAPRLLVSHVITGFDTGGAERVLLKTIQRLDPSKFESFVVSLRPPGPLSAEVARTGIETIYLGMGRCPGPRTLWQLSKLLQKRQVKIVHAYLYMASIASRLAGRWGGVPVVITSTRAPLAYLPRFAWWIDRATMRWCNRVIAVSQDTAEVAVRVERIPHNKITVIPNGVDLARFKPRDKTRARASLGIPKQAFVITLIGRLNEQKGHRYLFEAIVSVRQRIPRLQCVLAGDGPLRRKLETEAKNLGILDICRFLGDVRQVEDVLAAADVTVLPSLFEGLPNVVLEAMAMGCPVVASNIGGSNEVVRDRETGLLVPPADSPALGAALVSLASSAELREDLGKHARVIAEREHGIEQMVRAVERVYLEEWQKFTVNHGKVS